MTSAAVPGIDREAVTGWLRGRVADCEPPLGFELIAGGRSNLTYRVTDAGGRQWALRRPPLHSVLPTAHDVLRECRVMTALEPTSVPVPPIVGHDTELLDAPFYVMDFVPGLVVRDQDTADRCLAEPSRRAIAFALIDTLADLHAVDPAAVGLQDLGRGAGYVERQLRRWQQQAEAQRPAPSPLADRVHRALTTSVPEGPDVTIVHGDFRLDNVIVEPSAGRIEAVLDWELCTLGDPLADLGVFLSYWTEPGDAVRPFPSVPTVATGFPTRQELIDRYARRSGRDVAAVPYYLAFAHWRLALVLEGVYARFAAGAYGDADPSGYAYMPQVIADMIGHAADLTGTTAPDSSAPATTAPDSSAPATTAPDSSAPGTTAP